MRLARIHNPVEEMEDDGLAVRPLLLLEQVVEHLAAIRDALSQPAVAPQTLTVDDVGQQLQVSKETVVRAIKNGHLKAADVSERSGDGKHRAEYRIRQEWVDEYLDRKSQHPDSPPVPNARNVLNVPKRAKQTRPLVTEFIK